MNTIFLIYAVGFVVRYCAMMRAQKFGPAIPISVVIIEAALWFIPAIAMLVALCSVVHRSVRNRH